MTDSVSMNATEQALKKNILLLQDAETHLNVNYIMRVLLFTSDIRKSISYMDLLNIMDVSIQDDSDCKHVYLNAIQSLTNTLSNSSSKKQMILDHTCTCVDIYLGYILCYLLYHNQQYEISYSVCTYIIDTYKSMHNNVIDIMVSKIFSLFELICQTTNKFSEVKDYVFGLYRNTCLFNNYVGQASLYNMILSMYIHNKEYESASIFMNRSVFPTGASDKQNTRYLYYKGLIECIQLEYSNSLLSLEKALRAVENTHYQGIQTKIHKIYILVQLLMGDVPDRHIFNTYISMSTNIYSSIMTPYYYLTQIVRVGDVQGFTKYVENNKNLFIHDGTYHLILRLRSNVLRLALRQIYLSYSRISLQEISERLSVQPEEAEFICARTIRDGVIDAVLNHEDGYLTSKDMNKYKITEAPRIGFQKRINKLFTIKHEILTSKQ